MDFTKGRGLVILQCQSPPVLWSTFLNLLPGTVPGQFVETGRFASGYGRSVAEIPGPRPLRIDSQATALKPHRGAPFDSEYGGFIVESTRAVPGIKMTEPGNKFDRTGAQSLPYLGAK